MQLGLQLDLSGEQGFRRPSSTASSPFVVEDFNPDTQFASTGSRAYRNATASRRLPARCRRGKETEHTQSSSTPAPRHSDTPPTSEAGSQSQERRVLLPAASIADGALFGAAGKDVDPIVHSRRGRGQTLSVNVSPSLSVTDSGCGGDSGGGSIEEEPASPTSDSNGGEEGPSIFALREAFLSETCPDAWVQQLRNPKP